MNRSPFTTMTGRAVPLMLENVDTDVIIRVERMISTDPKTLAKWAFESLRYDGKGEAVNNFVLNDPAYSGAPFLVAGENFGCGSSREPAVWALMGLGFCCVIAPSFGDIFRANCLTNGVLPIALNSAAVEALATAASSPSSSIAVDLPAQTVSLGSQRWSFEIGAAHKRMLVEGLDETDLALSATERILEWETADRHARPWAWPGHA